MYTLKKKTKSTRKRYQNKKNYKKSKKQSKKQVKKQTKKHAKKHAKKQINKRKKGGNTDDGDDNYTAIYDNYATIHDNNTPEEKQNIIDNILKTKKPGYNVYYVSNNQQGFSTYVVAINDKGEKYLKISEEYELQGGSPQPYYWAPMRKLNYNPEFDTTLPVSEKPIEVTSPVYGCKNPVNVVKTGGQGPYVETECAYKAEGASSYGYDSPAGLSNGLITENNIQSAGAPGSTRHVEQSENEQHSYDKQVDVEINDKTIQDIIKKVCKMDDENEKKNYLLSLNKETLTKIHEKLNT
jgi:hypothetical protein